MASNLRLSFPTIPDDALSITLSSSADDDRNGFNTVTGRRDQRFKFAATSTNETIDYDLGTGTTDTADHAIIARADLIDNVSQVLIRRSTDAMSWTTEHTQSTFVAGTDLVGPNNNDLLMEFTESSAYRYWRVDLTASSASDFECSKIYLGAFFDPGRDPVAIKTLRNDHRMTDFVAADGARYPVEHMDAHRIVSITWDVLTDANADSLYRKLMDRRKRYLFIHADSTLTGLEGEKLLHVESLQDVEYRQRAQDVVTVSAVFREMVG